MKAEFAPRSRTIFLQRVLCLVGLIVLCGACSAKTGHEVLSFFFDGVPPLGGSKSGEAPSADAGKAAEGADPAPHVKQVITMVQHPPFAEQMCDSCHQLPKKRGGAPMGFGLLAEREELCQMCHDDMSPENLAETYTYVHGPVQYGACIKCHHPHESPNPFMLRASPVRKLCFRCHDENRMLGGDIHGEMGEMDCTECHDPHGGPERFYLKM